MPKFNEAARCMPYCALTDLDRNLCAPKLIREWLPNDQHNNLIFRVAVHEVESWLLADQEPFAHFTGIARRHIPENPDLLDDPKAKLLNLMRRSRKAQIRNEMLPRDASVRQGPGYNGRMSEFIEQHWRPDVARQYSPSLHAAMRALEGFQPVWPNAESDLLESE